MAAGAAAARHHIESTLDGLMERLTFTRFVVDPSISTTFTDTAPAARGPEDA